MDKDSIIRTSDELKKAMESYECDKKECLDLIAAFTSLACEYAKNNRRDKIRKCPTGACESRERTANKVDCCQ